MMKNNKTLETAGLAGIVAIFASGVIVYANLFRQVIQFILNWQKNGITTDHLNHL